MRYALVVALPLLIGCAASTPYRTSSLVFDAAETGALGSDPDEVQIARVVARVLRDRLELPLPVGTTIRVYVNQATFAEGLMRDGAQVRDEAWDRARVGIAAASPRGLFVRGDLVNGMRLVDKVGLMAHELAHVSQIEMGRGSSRGTPASWILEGHADWVKYQVLELLGMRSYLESRDEATRTILRAATPIAFFPPLGEIAGADRWTDASIRLGWAATYGQAFLAIDMLVERYGIEKLNTYQRRFATDADPNSHWPAVFPITSSEFLRQFRARLQQLVDADPDSTLAVAVR
jgi:hypothetical protein